MAVSGKQQGLGFRMGLGFVMVMALSLRAVAKRSSLAVPIAFLKNPATKFLLIPVVVTVLLIGILAVLFLKQGSSVPTPEPGFNEAISNGYLKKKREEFRQYQSMEKEVNRRFEESTKLYRDIVYRKSEKGEDKAKTAQKLDDLQIKLEGEWRELERIQLALDLMEEELIKTERRLQRERSLG